jgi:succinate dehydrogenase hydrophobic anchor subunit
MYNSISESINSYAMKFMLALMFLFIILQQYHTWIGLPDAFFDFMLAYMNSNSLFYKFLIGFCLFLFVSQFIITFLKNVSSHKIPKELGGS